MSKGTGPGKNVDLGKEDKNAASERKVDVEVFEENEESNDGEALQVDEEERVEVLAEDVEELAEQNAVLLDSLKRLKADFDNYRKRMIKEQTRILETAEAGLVKKLLPVMDNLERALASARETEASPLSEGVSKVLEMMTEILAKEGLEVIDPEGEPFDPEHHEAMMVVETDDCPEDTVMDVIQKGYRFAGVMLRPAMVRVSCSVKR
jgi:molecular chaperone GrpE